MTKEEAIEILGRRGAIGMYGNSPILGFEIHRHEADSIIDFIQSQAAEIERLKAFEPRFKLGDTVWLETFNQDRFQSYVVAKVLFSDTEGEDRQYCLYNVVDLPNGTTEYEYIDDFVDESELYASEQEALDSLRDKND